MSEQDIYWAAGTLWTFQGLPTCLWALVRSRTIKTDWSASCAHALAVTVSASTVLTMVVSVYLGQPQLWFGVFTAIAAVMAAWTAHLVKHAPTLSFSERGYAWIVVAVVHGTTCYLIAEGWFS